MAKTTQVQAAVEQARAQAQGDAGASPAPQGDAELVKAAALAEENARLRAENEQLKAAAVRPPAVAPAATDRPTGRLQRYAVKLGGAKVRHPVCPHCKAAQPMQPPGERDPEKTVRCQAPACGQEYKLRDEGYQMRDAMLVEAISEGDAKERYNRASGVISTSQKHEVTPV